MQLVNRKRSGVHCAARSLDKERCSTRGGKEVEEKVGKEEKEEEEKEEEEQANKNIVKEAVALVQHARLNPSFIYRQLLC